jgi:glycerol-3-phosphate O-acyltransferase/dihydroxyacetone phosphate acyltransferase
MALLDPEGIQVLRLNRNKLSRDITDIINEYGPQVFHDFDGKRI